MVVKGNTSGENTITITITGTVTTATDLREHDQPETTMRTGMGEAGNGDRDHTLPRSRGPGHLVEGQRSHARALPSEEGVQLLHQRGVGQDLDLGRTLRLDGTVTTMVSERCRAGILQGPNEFDLEVHVVMIGAGMATPRTEQQDWQPCSRMHRSSTTSESEGWLTSQSEKEPTESEMMLFGRRTRSTAGVQIS
jgi:hypothetical protein